MPKVSKPLVGICFTLVTNMACADHPTVILGGDSYGPINTIVANTMPRGIVGFGVRTEVINNDSFSEWQLENLATQGIEGAHSADKVVSTSFSIAYGINDDLTIGARIPYIRRSTIREGELEGGIPEVHVHGNSSGIGDALLFGQRRLTGNDNTDVSILFGIKTPTGETDVKDNNGVRFETEFQPGSGSWDFLVGVAVSKNVRRFGYHANVLYNATTEGSQSTEIGDVFSFNAAMSYRLSEGRHPDNGHEHHHQSELKGLKWDLIMELNGETRGKNKIFGISETNSGGTTVYLSPGVKVSAGNGIGGFISLGIPVLQNLNGTQTDVDNRIVAGISFAH
jgi:hypothetical protein